MVEVHRGVHGKASQSDEKTDLLDASGSGRNRP
jgi:hypothetical protein